MDNNFINSHLVRQILNRKAYKLNTLDFIFSELAQRVISRLDFIKINPKKILECESGLGFDFQQLVAKYPTAAIIELDLALNLLKTRQIKRSIWAGILGKKSGYSLLCADAHLLPIANASIDFVYANLLLPYLHDIPAFIRELRRVLGLGGSFCIAGLGVDSFKEIRELGLRTRVFPDMHDIGDMLLAAGFTNPVVDTEYITLEYDDLATMLADIRLLGCGASITSSRSCLTKKALAELKNKYDKPCKLTLEMFVAHGWKEQNKIDLPPGQSVINFMPPHKKG